MMVIEEYVSIYAFFLLLFTLGLSYCYLAKVYPETRIGKAEIKAILKALGFAGGVLWEGFCQGCAAVIKRCEESRRQKKEQQIVLILRAYYGRCAVFLFKAVREKASTLGLREPMDESGICAVPDICFLPNVGYVLHYVVETKDSYTAKESTIARLLEAAMVNMQYPVKIVARYNRNNMIDVYVGVKI